MFTPIEKYRCHAARGLSFPMRIDGNLKTLGWYLSREKALVALSMAREIVWSPALNPENYAPG